MQKQRSLSHIPFDEFAFNSINVIQHSLRTSYSPLIRFLSHFSFVFHQTHAAQESFAPIASLLHKELRIDAQAFTVRKTWGRSGEVSEHEGKLDLRRRASPGRPDPGQRCMGGQAIARIGNDSFDTIVSFLRTPHVVQKTFK